MITFAKAITNGVIPMGGVIVRGDIYDTIVNAGGQEQAVEFFHGFTYSGHPIATAAAHASLDIFENDGIMEKTRKARLVYRIIVKYSSNPDKDLQIFIFIIFLFK